MRIRFSSVTSFLNEASAFVRPSAEDTALKRRKNLVRAAGGTHKIIKSRAKSAARSFATDF